MNSHHFDQEADDVVGQMLGILSPKEADLLRDDLQSLGLEAWLDWEFDHRAETTAFLTATQKERTAKKTWQEEPLRSRLLLSGFLQARLARVMMFETSNLLALAEDKGALARAIHAAFRVSRSTYAAIWPFSGEAPFPEWTAERKALNQDGMIAHGHSMPDGSVQSFVRSPDGDIPVVVPKPKK